MTNEYSVFYLHDSGSGTASALSFCSNNLVTDCDATNPAYGVDVSCTTIANVIVHDNLFDKGGGHASSSIHNNATNVQDNVVYS